MHDDTRHTLKLSCLREIIHAFLDGKELARVKGEAKPQGMIGLGSGWHGAQFDHLKIDFHQ